MNSKTLVTTDDLLRHLNDSDWVICDVRYELGDPLAGRRKYDAGHIPGAVFVDMNRDLASPPDPARGRHPLPDSAILASKLGAIGVGPGVQVVAYDDASGTWASRLWWLLKYLGHDDVAVLDGGIQAWTGDLVTREETGRAARHFIPNPRPEMIASLEDVEASLDDPTRLLIDSRSPDRFRGENETIDPVGGRIPGARNRFFKANFDDSGVMKSATELRSELSNVLGDREPSDAIVYCGSGVTACANLLALEHSGLRGARLYPGSWSEWCSDKSRPIATGD